MQFLTIAFTQALLATAMAVPVANSLFSLTAVNSENFPEGLALVAKQDGTIWINSNSGETQLVAGAVTDNNLVHGIQVGDNHALLSSVDGEDTLSLSDDAFLVENGNKKATGCVAANGETQIFLGDADCATKVDLTLRANPINAADGVNLKNNFCFGGHRKSQPCAHNPPCEAPVYHPPPCTNEPDCSCCPTCPGCIGSCACSVANLLNPKKWCNTCKGPDCYCEPPARQPCAPKPPMQTVTVTHAVPAPTAHRPSPPCNECGSPSCGGCPAQKCGSCLQNIADCLCPLKKMPCQNNCNPPCNPHCGAPRYEPPCDPPHHTLTQVVTATATATATATTVKTVSAPSVLPEGTTTRFHTVTVPTDVTVSGKASA